MYEIMQCDTDDAAYNEGHVYDLIKTYFPNITLINTNKTNRCKQESGQHWRSNNLEYIRIHNRKWREEHPDYRKHGAMNTPTILNNIIRNKHRYNKYHYFI